MAREIRGLASEGMNEVGPHVNSLSNAMQPRKRLKSYQGRVVGSRISESLGDSGAKAGQQTPTRTVMTNGR